MRKITVLVAAMAMLMTMAGGALAYTLNPDGTGFVGKGEVQTAFGWNNNQLQRNAEGVDFEAVTVTVTERDWTCSRTNPQGEEQTQERERTTTTTTTGVVDHTARERNQITGFNLTGWGQSSSTTVTDGPQEGSCPSGWTASAVTTTGPEIVSSELYAVHGNERVLLP